VVGVLPGANGFCRAHQRGVLHLSDTRAGLGVHGDHFAGFDDLKVANVAQVCGSADQHDRYAEFFRGATSASDNLSGRIVAAHGVDRDRQH
jgi:hypothetical protein